MDSLPVELLEAIVQDISPGHTLLQARLLNRTFCAMVTPLAFKRVNVTNTPESAEAFSNIVRSKTLACLVQEIFFREAYSVSKEEGLEALENSLTSSFSYLRRLPLIKCLSQFYSPSPWALQMAILRGISVQLPLATLTSLTINGLFAYHGPQYDTPDFQNLFRGLDAIRISPSWGLEPPPPHIRPSFVFFWEHTMQLRVLSPLASFSRSLTSFTLHSNLDVGVVPRVDFSQLDFPALASLSLQMILFNEETHVEDFIVRHKLTLKSLHLAQCHIASYSVLEGPPQVWSQIWTHFADELEALVQLSVEPGHNANQVRPHHSSYVHLDERAGHSYLRVDEKTSAEDDMAERMFHEVVRSRRHKLTSQEYMV
ncbi:hypothetical protein HETIRDRAFT_328021 [Heterobasidion irregulare TC 32-1]|uniref:F-box domain-containing protein n=1 Tax=Heterobasidion irregulare (strain TC 32-1) TaxID=747525 RepID=W4JTM2_HETIT|nr:uncharacterized protein HETIRDRAFT_328021 [Heterobasidion irregulare TC 32-1]ETW76784.1 hypothetical protein HETIRDRAFT_328021 [Heterobasidion irregulare TC 32-1]